MSVVLLLALVLGARLHRALLGRAGTGVVFHLLRLPGNLLHEAAHAVATLACGYTVAGFNVSLFDPAGRGEVRPGRPWTRFARPWVADLVAPVAPLAAGIAALVALAAWAGVPALPMAWAGVEPAVRAVPWTAWQGWVALGLAVPIAADMVPSDVDLRAWAKPALVVGAVLGLAGWLLQREAPGLLAGWWGLADAPVATVLARALSLVAWATLPWAPVAWIVGKARG